MLDAISQAIERDSRARNERREVAELRRRYDSLTPREREVMQRVVAGLLTAYPSPNNFAAASDGLNTATFLWNPPTAIRAEPAKPTARDQA